MNFSVPPIPIGIHNPNDLLNGRYPQHRRIAWSDIEFHAKLQWIKSRITNLQNVLFSFAFIDGPVGGITPTAVTFTGNGWEHITDAYVVDSTPTALAVHLLESAGLVSPNPAIPYPGKEHIFDTAKSPVGEPWLDHPWIVQGNTGLMNRLFHPSTSDGDHFKAGDQFKQVDTGGRVDTYTKMLFLSQVVTNPELEGPFDTANFSRFAVVWQLTQF